MKGLWAAAAAILAGLAATGDHAWREPASGMRFVRIPAGSFLMGTPPGEPEREAQEGLHPVTLARAFFLGRHEVTQQEWFAVMGTRPSAFADCGGRCPVESVNYSEVQTFLARLRRLSPGRDYRLPSEAEWEYACRAGGATPFATGARLSTRDANVDGRFPLDGDAPEQGRGRPLPVESFRPNAWGLYDMHGNVWEWCADWHCPYTLAPATDPEGRCESGLRVIRGGSWAFSPGNARCGLRYTHRPKDRGHSLGFRVAFDVPKRL
jgi:formylglycine-generating enzyme required for sulfatase activity